MLGVGLISSTDLDNLVAESNFKKSITREFFDINHTLTLSLFLCPQEKEKKRLQLWKRPPSFRE